MGPPGPPFPTPPRRRRRTTWIVVAVAIVLVAAATVVLVLVLGKDPDKPRVANPPQDRVDTSTGGSVTMHITDTLDPSWETFEVVTVTSQGAEVGTLEVSEVSPDATLMVTSPAGPASYELDVTFFDLDGNQGSCVGTGTIDASEGAMFAVVAQAVGSGCAASLEQQ
jgi:hypothetical protein